MSPLESTRGWLPSSGHSFLSLKPEVSQLTWHSVSRKSRVIGGEWVSPTSSMTWGILTGWLSGHLPLTTGKDTGPPIGCATCSRWFGLSRFLPSQHLFEKKVGLISGQPEGRFGPALGCSSNQGLLRKYDVGPNPADARLFRQVVGVPLGIETGWRPAAAKVGLGIAAVALLHLVTQILGRAPAGIAGEHAEALRVTEVSAAIRSLPLVTSTGPALLPA